MTAKKEPEKPALDEIWTQPDQMVKDAPIQLIYAEMAARLQQEVQARNGSVLDVMLAERCAALYGNIRQRETTNSFANDRNRKETLQLWIQLATQLKKQWAIEDESKLAEVLADKVTKAMHKALQDVPEEQRQMVAESLEQYLVEAGIG